jgi:hypothetical protein
MSEDGISSLAHAHNDFCALTDYRCMADMVVAADTADLGKVAAA